MIPRISSTDKKLLVHFPHADTNRQHRKKTHDRPFTLMYLYYSVIFHGIFASCSASAAPSTRSGLVRSLPTRPHTSIPPSSTRTCCRATPAILSYFIPFISPLFILFHFISFYFILLSEPGNPQLSWQLLDFLSEQGSTFAHEATPHPRSQGRATPFTREVFSESGNP
jgi:hypothetical protein